MTTNLELQYECTSVDLKEAFTLLNRDKLDSQADWERKCFTVLGPVIGLLVLVHLLRTHPVPTVAVLVCGGVAAFYFFKKGPRRAATYPCGFEVSELGILTRGDTTKAIIRWNHFSDRIESPNLFVLKNNLNGSVFVIPKRVFPDENSISWFRSCALGTPQALSPMPSDNPKVSTPASDEQLELNVKLDLRDFILCALVSLKTWAQCLLGIVIIFAMTLRAIPKNSPLNDTTILLILYAIVVITCLCSNSVRCMRWAETNANFRKIALSDQSFAYSNSEIGGSYSWSQLNHWNETPWSFILWNTSYWTIIPKRSFRSREDVNRCRDLLGRHSNRSRWFFG